MFVKKAHGSLPIDLNSSATAPPVHCSTGRVRPLNFLAPRCADGITTSPTVRQAFAANTSMFGSYLVQFIGSCFGEICPRSLRDQTHLFCALFHCQGFVLRKILVLLMPGISDFSQSGELVLHLEQNYRFESANRLTE